MTPEVGEDFIQWRPPTGDDAMLGLVDFSICPHLAAAGMPGNSMAEAEQWAAGISGPAYAMDDQTAITVVDGIAEVVSEGHWRHFPLLNRHPTPPSVRRPPHHAAASLLHPEFGTCVYAPGRRPSHFAAVPLP